MTPFVRFLSEKQEGKVQQEEEQCTHHAGRFRFWKEDSNERAQRHHLGRHGVAAWHSKQIRVMSRDPSAWIWKMYVTWTYCYRWFNSLRHFNLILQLLLIPSPKSNNQTITFIWNLSFKCPAHTPKIQKKRKTRNLSLCLKQKPWVNVSVVFG